MASSASTIEKLRQVFAQFGLPETVVSDNAAYFTSQEFESYLELNAIRHTKSSPYHPSSKSKEHICRQNETCRQNESRRTEM